MLRKIFPTILLIMLILIFLVSAGLTGEDEKKSVRVEIISAVTTLEPQQIGISLQFQGMDKDGYLRFGSHKTGKERPPKDNIFLIVNFSAYNESDDEINVQASDFSVVDKDGSKYKGSLWHPDFKAWSDSMGTVIKGKEVNKDKIIFKVPKTQAKKLIFLFQNEPVGDVIYSNKK
ncbi:MAG: DUF4352 domain-containing protein [Candidatus Omnitrophica bacterium]|nr:DUF4352 domain-containing protein [Candidatus Omnitrophota bacterium]